mmetsp:Transcript_26730/g.70239  ORF Transcript_26730/g.70239 Transcript_26730/m.70239 type:complete len:311 (-) Transcript_26730:1499-2431(-)
MIWITSGADGFFEKSKRTVRPFFSQAVMGGIAPAGGAAGVVSPPPRRSPSPPPFAGGATAGVGAAPRPPRPRPPSKSPPPSGAAGVAIDGPPSRPIRSPPPPPSGAAGAVGGPPSRSSKLSPPPATGAATGAAVDGPLSRSRRPPLPAVGAAGAAPLPRRSPSRSPPPLPPPPLAAGAAATGATASGAPPVLCIERVAATGIRSRSESRMPLCALKIEVYSTERCCSSTWTLSANDPIMVRMRPISDGIRVDSFMMAVSATCRVVSVACGKLITLCSRSRSSVVLPSNAGSITDPPKILSPNSPTHHAQI